MNVFVHSYSLCSYHLMLLVGDVSKPFFLSGATGFLWEHEEDVYLVTNWHVLTGKNYLTGQNLSLTGARPTDILVDQVYSKATLSIPSASLYMDGIPQWIEHPTYGPNVDIAVIKLVWPPEIKRYSINKAPKCAHLELAIGRDVFLVGYPLGRSGIPIWKRGSIASEPSLMSISSTSRFYVDTLSRPGMSGSPVILHKEYQPGRSGCSGFDKIGCNRFVGIYSSRVPANEDGAQLGAVFPESLIEDIFNSIGTSDERRGVA